jgi:hypothetical protein
MPSWPLSAQLRSAPSRPPCHARAYSRVILDEWGLAALSDPAELIASELVTNSVQASTDNDGRLKVWRGRPASRAPAAGLRPDMRPDRGLGQYPQPPAARRPRPYEEHGRGLALIQALSDRWGWTTIPGWPGKVGWAELRPGWERTRRPGRLRTGRADQVGGHFQDDRPQFVRVVDLLPEEHVRSAHGEYRAGGTHPVPRQGARAR